MSVRKFPILKFSDILLLQNLCSRAHFPIFANTTDIYNF